MGDALHKIEKLMKSLDRILELCENNSVLNQASESSIKENFALASSLEKFFSKLHQSGCIDTMQVRVSDIWKQQGRNVPNDFGVFEESCDLLLTACLRSPSLTHSKLSTAVSEYEHYCGSDRLQELVVHLLREGTSCQLLYTLAASLPSLLSAVFLGWQNMMECGQSPKVRNLIISFLNHSSSHVGSVLEFILKSADGEDTTSLKALLMDCVETKMKEEHSSEFCSHLVNSTEATMLVLIAERYPRFLTPLLQCLQTLADGAALQCQQSGDGVNYSWKDLGFPLELVQQLCKSQGPVATRTLSWLSMLQSRPGCSLWEDITACCGV